MKLRTNARRKIFAWNALRNKAFPATIAAALAMALTACQPSQPTEKVKVCAANLIVLGTAQGAGKPQIGNNDDPAWRDATLMRTASSLALVDSTIKTYHLFDATPDIKFQMFRLEKTAGVEDIKLAGVFLTHGHMGHYLGLAQFGREAMGAKALPVYAMPKMVAFLEQNGPWDLMVRLKNIEITVLTDKSPITFSNDIKVTPFSVPHRGEYTETVGYRITGKSKSAIYLPDIDSWEAWEKEGTKLADVIAKNDIIFIDGTFFSGDELPGRDMSKIPHPTMTTTMDTLRALPSIERTKVRFIHLNHSNPVHDEHTNSFQTVEKAGYGIAKAGERFCLD